MSGGFPFERGTCAVQDTTNTLATATLANVFPSGSLVKGAFTQLSSGLPNDADMALVTLFSASIGSAVQGRLYDFSVGGAGSEVIFASNLQASLAAAASLDNTVSFPIPVNIPAGTRIAARLESTSTSTVSGFQVTAKFYDGSFASEEGYAGFECATASTGTAVAPVITSTSTIANVKTTYTQLVASTARDYCGIGFSFGPSSLGGVSWITDVAIGGAGVEQIIAPNMPSFSNSTQLMYPILPINIPSGTRVAARTQNSGTTANATLPVSIYGLYK